MKEHEFTLVLTADPNEAEAEKCMERSTTARFRQSPECRRFISIARLDHWKKRSDQRSAMFVRQASKLNELRCYPMRYQLDARVRLAGYTNQMDRP